MAELVKLNGSPVRATALYRRTATGEDGTPREEVELAVHLRGRMAHRSFATLLQGGLVRLELANGDVLETEVTAAASASSGEGEATIYRHDFTLRELPEATERRLAVIRAAMPATPVPAPTRAAPETNEEDPDAPADLSAVRVSGNASAWATALRQMTAPHATVPTPPSEPPLAPAELAGVEAVLVGLRLEALIEELGKMNLVRRPALDDAFLRLVGERFVAEATPVVGEPAARRAARDLTG